MAGLKKSDFQKLQYIYSNRMITPKLFQMKFFPGMTIERSRQLLRRYVREKYLFPEKRTNPFYEVIYRMTDIAVKDLKDKGFILTKNHRYIPIKKKNQRHHEHVIALRIAIESNPDFQDVYFISDHEIEKGITREAHWNFTRLPSLEERKEFLKNWKAKRKYQGERYPDGYFEALAGGKHQAFVLEYVGESYSYPNLRSILNQLEDGRLFSTSTKLVVAEDSERTERFRTQFQNSVKFIQRRGGFKSKWLISDYQTAIKKPFFEAFKPLNFSENKGK